MSLSDDEYVAAVVASIDHWRARNAAFGEAVKNIEVDAINNAVIPRWDTHGTLLELDIDPAAMNEYTNTELEEIITTVLSDSRHQVQAHTMELFARYVNPLDPRFEPNILGVPYASLPENDTYQPGQFGAEQSSPAT